VDTKWLFTAKLCNLISPVLCLYVLTFFQFYIQLICAQFILCNDISVDCLICIFIHFAVIYALCTKIQVVKLLVFLDITLLIIFISLSEIRQTLVADMGCWSEPLLMAG